MLKADYLNLATGSTARVAILRGTKQRLSARDFSLRAISAAAVQRLRRHVPVGPQADFRVSGH